MCRVDLHVFKQSNTSRALCKIILTKISWCIINWKQQCLTFEEFLNLLYDQLVDVPEVLQLWWTLIFEVACPQLSRCCQVRRCNACQDREEACVSIAFVLDVFVSLNCCWASSMQKTAFFVFYNPVLNK